LGWGILNSPLIPNPSLQGSGSVSRKDAKSTQRRELNTERISLRLREVFASLREINPLSTSEKIWQLNPISLNFAPAKDDRRERNRSLLHFPEMNIDSQIQAIEQKVEVLISPDPQSFLVEVKIRPGNNIMVFIDADQGVSIEKLVQYNRRLYKLIEESSLFPNDDFSLEVSSPGLDEPLKLHRQYLKNIGRDVEVILKDGVKKEGKLLSASNNEIIIEEEKARVKTEKGKQAGKKKDWVEHTIPYEDIKTTKIQIKF
jgi:ribosome maturation factor RimP